MAHQQGGDSGGFLAIQTFNIAYDTCILPYQDFRERLFIPDRFRWEYRLRNASRGGGLSLTL